MITSVPPSEFKSCNTCNRELAITRFDRLKSGCEKRRANCRDCRCAKQRAYRRKKRGKELTGFTQRIEQRKDRPSVVEGICGTMVHRFGGLNNFCHEWYTHIMATPRGSAYVCRQLKCIVQLIMVSSQIQMQRQSDLEDLSDEELEREIEVLARKVFEVVEVDSSAR